MASSVTTRYRRYDFRQPNKFSRDQLRTLERIFEGWAKYSAPHLSTTLRLGIEVGEITSEEVVYSSYYQSLDDSVVGVIEPSALPGAFLVSLRVRGALQLYNRLLGSNRGWEGETRDLTEIESATIEMVISQIIDAEMKAAWEPLLAIDFQLVNFGQASNFFGVVPLNEAAVLIRVPMGGEDLDLELCFCLPYAGLEPIIDQLSTQEYFNRSLRQSYRDRTFAKRLPGIPIEVSARLATIQMRYQDVEKLDVGSVIPLPRAARDRVAVYVDGEQVFTARPHVSSVDGRYLFKIDQVLAPGIEKMLAATGERA